VLLTQERPGHLQLRLITHSQAYCVLHTLVGDKTSLWRRLVAGRCGSSSLQTRSSCPGGTSRCNSVQDGARYIWLDMPWKAQAPGASSFSNHSTSFCSVKALSTLPVV
jgi:hypothetical protein